MFEGSESASSNQEPPTILAVPPQQSENPTAPEGSPAFATVGTDGSETNPIVFKKENKPTKYIPYIFVLLLLLGLGGTVSMIGTRLNLFPRAFLGGTAPPDLNNALITSVIGTGTGAQTAVTVGSGVSLTYADGGTINASSLEDCTWESPCPIGSVTPNSGIFTTLSANQSFNAVLGISTGADGGTQRIDDQGNITNIGTTEFNGITYTWPLTQTKSFFLQTNGLGQLTWADPEVVIASAAASVNDWSITNGAISPATKSLDLLLGSDSTGSAKFAFKNVSSGTPTLSILYSGNLVNLTGDGTLSTTNGMGLTIGGNSTGAIHLTSSGYAGLTVDTSGMAWIGGTTNNITATTSPVFKTGVDFVADYTTPGIALGSDGFARMTYSYNGLQFARCTNADCTTKNLTLVDSVEGYGGNNAVAMGTDGYARIAYYSGFSTANLKYVQCTNADCTTSNITTIDSTGDVGTYPSIKIGGDGFARIAYYDATNTALKFVQCLNDACTSSNITTVDNTEDDGSYLSMALGNDGYARISYYNATNQDLKFAQCTNSACTSFNITTVDSGSVGGGEISSVIGNDGYARISYTDGNRVRFVQCANDACNSSTITTISDSYFIAMDDTALTVGSDGYGRIVFWQSDAVGGNPLKIIRCTNISCSSHTIQALETGLYRVPKPPVAVMGSDDYVQVAYVDWANNILRFIRTGTASFIPNSGGLYVNGSVGVNGDIVTNGNAVIGKNAKVGQNLLVGNDNPNLTVSMTQPWVKTTIDTAASVTGNISVTEYNDMPQMTYESTYQDATNGQTTELNFLRCSAGESGWPDCSASVITTIANNGSGDYSDIKMGSDNLPRITYFDGNLHFVQCTNRDCITKNSTTIDSGSQAGKYVSMAIGSDGFARIAYQDATNSDLKFIQCTNADCSTRNTTTVASTGSVGYYASMALGTDGFARIVYSDLSGSPNYALNFVQCTNADCSTNVNTTVASNASFLPYSSMSLGLGSDTFGRFTYYRNGIGLSFVKCTNAACSTNTSNVIDTSARTTTPSLQTPNAPIISYISGHDELKLATCSDSACAGKTTITVDKSSGGGFGAQALHLGSMTTLAYTTADYNFHTGTFRIAIEGYLIDRQTPILNQEYFNPAQSSIGVSGNLGVGGNSYIQGSQVISDALEVKTGVLIGSQFYFTSDGLTPQVYVDATGGKMGVGSTSPDSKLQVSGGGLCVGSDANCTTSDNTEGVVYSSSTAMTVYDVAENYPTKDTTLSATEVVELDPANGVFVKRAESPYSNRLLGVISANPAVLLGGFNGQQYKDERQVAVALSGRIPVKVAPDSPAIAIGDALTASSTYPGMATKAVSTGYSIGKALDTWVPESGQDTVMFFANISWFDQNITVQGLDGLTIGLSDNPGVPGYAIADAKGGIIQAVAAYANSMIANLEAGIVKTQDLTTNSLFAFQGVIDHMLVKTGLVSESVLTSHISPAPGETNVEIQVGSTSTPSGELIVQNASGSAVASIDSEGNATFSGVVKARNIDDIQALLTQVQADQSVLAAATSASNLTTTNLFVTNQATVNGLSISDTISLGTDFVVQSATNSIDTLSAPLRIESLGMARIEFMKGLVSIDTKGNMIISGDLAVGGKVEAASVNVGTGGTSVASIDASGSAIFNSLQTQQISGSDLIRGSVDIPVGTDTVSVQKSWSAIPVTVLVTPNYNTQSWIENLSQGGFTVKVSATPSAQPQKVYWWAIW